MAFKGNSGTSLGGGVIHTRRKKPKQRNIAPCPICGAGKGQPCFESVPGRGLRDLPKTHTRQDAKRS